MHGDPRGVGSRECLSPRNGSGGKLFGSVTAADVVDAVRSAGGPSLDRRAVDLGGHIKATGKYEMTVRLHPEVSVTVPFEITTAAR